MHVDGQQALAVIEHDEVALVIKWTCQQHCAVVHGLDGSSSRDAEIQAPMGARGLAVENSLGAEDVRNLSLSRGDECAGPFAIGRDAVQVVLLNLAAFIDLFLLLWGGLSELAFNVKLRLDFRILAAGDRELASERNFPAGC